MANTSQLKHLIRFCRFAVIIASVALALGASSALAEVQNLCLQEIDGIVLPDEYGNISTPEACNLDETTSGISATNNSWGAFISGAPGSSVPNPPSGNGTGGVFSGVIPAVPELLTQGTKVTDPINGSKVQWTYKVAPGGPAKADLQQGATATYTYTQSPAFFSGGPATGDELLYYLLTRASNNGSELQGVWFFLGPVTFTDPTCTAGCSFTGHHTDGDLFLLSAFTKGGGQVGIQAYTWQCTGTGSACDDSGTLVNVANGACSGSGFGAQNDFLCGAVNDNTITVPGNLPNPSTGTTLGTGLFFNGGVDLNAFFPTAPCFSSVMFESISSPSCSTVPCGSIGSAAAKFFIFSTFNTCAIEANKTCGTGVFNADQTAATYPVAGIVSNKDGGALTLSSLTDSPPFDSSSLGCFTSAQSFNGSSCTASQDACLACETAFLGGVAGAPTSGNCSSAPLGKICYGATITNSVSTCVGKGCTDTVTAKATGPAGSTIKDAMATAANCSIPSLTAGLQVTKNCTAGLAATGSALQVQVNTGYLICNEQAAILSNVSLSDNKVSSANITKVSGGITCPSGTGLCLAPEGKSGDCATFMGSYIPTSLSDISGFGTTCSSQNPTQDFLSDTATATGQCASSVCSRGNGCTLSGSTVTCTSMSGASCPLCPLQALSNSQCTGNGTPSACCTGSGTGTCGALPTEPGGPS